MRIPIKVDRLNPRLPLGNGKSLSPHSQKFNISMTLAIAVKNARDVNLPDVAVRVCGKILIRIWGSQGNKRNQQYFAMITPNL